ncbi:conserved hypothetical protein [Talaromyces stipitatus ATCC 10500]|uniref:C6 finger domain protein n=1 Tax=Talaromyces stipitatus (strain ATCC 10500 / CBS 375.48 / QM 6759 / NRRL 1006) TaxID=441959 RepID=B8M1Y2_TALSN|nr:uncharacterized protein TSTA_085910 [Talaromyces stipitatus ATCC 10500]EED21360.1 conserved hypothetical protein [Talaromyces stipitatus ATCC 10500]
MKVKNRFWPSAMCVYSGRVCEGYQTPWTFVDSSTFVSASKQRNTRETSQTRRHRKTLKVQENAHASVQQGLQPSLNPSRESLLARPSHDDFIALVVRNYVPKDSVTSIDNDLHFTKEPRICGAWVEVLPSLRSGRGGTRNLVLTAAVEALATSILTQKLYPNRDNIESFQSYELALRSLRKSVTVDQRSDVELLASIMCLSLVELMMPSTSVALEAHLKGAGQLFRAYGADACKAGVLHTLFAGFRPLLLIDAFQLRQTTFLASPKWIDVPFSICRASSMQSLLDKGAIIPSLLNQSDNLLDKAHEEGNFDVEARDLINHLVTTLIDLENWEMEYCQGIDRQCYWPSDRSELPLSKTSISQDKPLIYTSVTMANVYTNLWAFRIICLSELERFICYFPYYDITHDIPSHPLNLKHAKEHKIALAKQICLSMEYLLQDEMELFGPASTCFPLQIAYETFLENEVGREEEISFVEGVVSRLVRKGLRSAPVLVFARRTMRTV